MRLPIFLAIVGLAFVGSALVVSCNGDKPKETTYSAAEMDSAITASYERGKLDETARWGQWYNSRAEISLEYYNRVPAAPAGSLSISWLKEVYGCTAEALRVWFTPVPMLENHKDSEPDPRDRADIEEGWSSDPNMPDWTLDTLTMGGGASTIDGKKPTN